LDENKKVSNFGFYLVAFVDILGQKKILDDFDKMMTIGNPFNESDLLKKIQASFGVVEKFKIGFLSFLEEFCKVNQSTGLPPDLQKIFEESRKTNVKFKRFSDSITLYTPLFEKDTPVIANSIFAVMASIAVQVICNLADGHPIRGGVEIGFGSEIDDLFYGPGLFKAYHLESKVAEYPRVVVGPRLIEYLNSHYSSTETGFFNEINKKMAKGCLHLIEKDKEGIAFIDIFAPEIVQMNRKMGTLHMYHDANTFIHRCLEEFKTDKTLFKRYEILSKYFRKNLKLKQCI